MTNVNLKNNTIDVNEKPFQVDYKENLAVAFKMLEEIAMDLEKDVHAELVKELSRMDRAISDIRHLIEFVNFNVVEGYKFAKMMQEISRARREIKHRIDERNRMAQFLSTYTKMFKPTLQHQLKQQEGRQKALDSQKYEMRELNQLDGYLKVIEEQKSKYKVKQEEESYIAWKEEVQYASLEEAKKGVGNQLISI